MTIYFVEQMASPLFQVVTDAGEVLGELSIIDAEGWEYRLKKEGNHVFWIDRGLLKERKHVRDLISKNSVGMSNFRELGL